MRDAGLKLTPRRQAIIAMFSDSRVQLSPQEVQERLKCQFIRCGLPGVYRNLEALADCGVLFRVVGFGRERSYALCCCSQRDGVHHHHHVICISCGLVGQVESCAYQEGVVIEGFRVVSHVLQLRGICASCSSRETEASG
ncbi:MAG: transcriptional repressor [Chlorobium sp.]